MVNFLNLHILHLTHPNPKTSLYYSSHIFVSNDTINKHFLPRNPFSFLSFYRPQKLSYSTQCALHFSGLFVKSGFLCDFALLPTFVKMLHIKAYRKRNYCKDHKQQLKSPCWPKLVNCTFLLKWINYHYPNLHKIFFLFNVCHDSSIHTSWRFLKFSCSSSTCI